MDYYKYDGGKNLSCHVYECLMEDEKLPFMRRLTDKERFEAYIKIAQDNIDLKRNGEEVDNDYSWFLGYRLWNCCHDTDNNAEGVRYVDVEMSFKTEKARSQFVGFVSTKKEILDVDLCVEAKLYDERLFELCSIIPKSWLAADDKHVWKLAGFFYKKPFADPELMCRTFLCVLSSTLSNQFRYDRSIRAFDGWKDCKFHSMDEGKLQAMIGGMEPAGYRAWKAKYGKGAADASEKDPRKLKAAMLKALLEELKKLPRDLIKKEAATAR
jgi:hypothetical protein